MTEEFGKKIDPGILKAIEDHKKKKEQLWKEASKLPEKEQIIPVEELQGIEAVKRILRTFTNEPIETGEALERQFERLVKKLDADPLWAAKFTTADDDDPEIKNHSVYYMTPSGVSLRLKRISLKEKGLRRVIQPFADKIWFEPERKVTERSEKPVIGSYVKEVISKKFWDLQDKELCGEKLVDKPFVSPLKMRVQGDRIHSIWLGFPVEHIHEGHAVNKIFWNY